jgi:Protein of unknown function (DUF1570)
MIHRHLGASVCLVLLSGLASAQQVEEWKFDVVYRTGGREPYRGLITEETPDFVRITCVTRVTRNSGTATTLFNDTVPRKEVARLDRLDDKDRALLTTRLKTLRSERTILTAQIRLWQGGKLNLPPGEMLELKPAPWGKDGKEKALSYDSTCFRLVSNAREDIVLLTAIQLESVFSAYTRFLKPRGEIKQTTVLLTQSLEEYHKLVKERGHNILNPAYFDPRENQVVCGSDLERLSKEQSRVKEQHRKLLADLQARRGDLMRIYERQVPAELLGPIDSAFKRIHALEEKNSEVVKFCHLRLVQCLCHEAFHAYLHTSVFGESKRRVPAWLDEGLAQVFETALVEGGELRVGHPDKERRKRVRTALEKKQLVSLTDLLRSTGRQFQVAHSQERQMSDRFYLGAWGLAFFLMFNRQVLGSEPLEEYLKSLERGVDPLEAFSVLLGEPLDQAEKKWHDYLDRLLEDGTLAVRK